MYCKRCNRCSVFVTRASRSRLSVFLLILLRQCNEKVLKWVQHQVLSLVFNRNILQKNSQNLRNYESRLQNCLSLHCFGCFFSFHFVSLLSRFVSAHLCQNTCWDTPIFDRQGSDSSSWNQHLIKDPVEQTKVSLILDCFQSLFWWRKNKLNAFSA